MKIMRILFIIVALLNIAANIYFMTEANEATSVNAIMGWICAIFYSIR
jgi:hypothetical protein